MGKQRRGSGNEDDSKKGNYTSDLFITGEWLMEEDRTCPTSDDGRQKGDDGGIGQRQVLE